MVLTRPATLFLFFLGSSVHAEPALRVWRGTPMAGPFPSLETFCKSVQGECPADLERRPFCNTTADAKPARLLPPYLDVRTITTSCSDGHGTWGIKYDLAVRVTAGWYVAHAVFETLSGNAKYCDNVVRPKALEIVDLVPGAPPEIRLIAETWDRCRSDAIGESRTYLVVAGIGLSGKPGVAPALVIGQRTRRVDPLVSANYGEDENPGHVELRVAWPGGGILVLDPPGDRKGQPLWIKRPNESNTPSTEPGRYRIELP